MYFMQISLHRYADYFPCLTLRSFLFVFMSFRTYSLSPCCCVINLPAKYICTVAILISNIRPIYSHKTLAQIDFVQLTFNLCL